MTVYQPDVTSTGANSVTVGTPTPLSDGYITKVQPIDPTGSLALPHGRYYVQVVHLKSETLSATEALGILWAGYLHSGSGLSIPNVPCQKGQSVVIRVVAGSGGVTSARFLANVEVLDSVRVGGASIYLERPGDGPGEARTVSLGDPGAGAEYPTLILPNRIRWELEGCNLPFVTSATVAARKPRVVVDDATNAYKGAVAEGSVAASLTVTFVGKKGSSNGSDVAQVGAIGISMPGGQIPGAHRVSFVTTNLQVGDNYGAGFLGVREWAVESV